MKIVVNSYSIIRNSVSNIFLFLVVKRDTFTAIPSFEADRKYIACGGSEAAAGDECVRVC